MEEFDIAGEDGRRSGDEGQKRATKQDVLFSPVPPESHIEPLLYRDDGTGAHGDPTGTHKITSGSVIARSKATWRSVNSDRR